ADSVQQALRALEAADDVVLVHDAVRPWVTTDLLTSVVDAALRHGAAIAAVPATDTVKQVEDGIVTGTPDRRQLWHAQTPQGFRRSLLEEAFAQRDPSQPATDESSLVEACGHRVHIVHGDPTNVKVTTPQDLSPQGASSRTLRVGQGYDVHAFADDRPLILGGIQIEAQRGLAGHSDADVLTHAIIDALLGATSMGDVGQLFPDTDQAYAGISSLLLLADVSSRLQAIGAQIVNVDSVVMAQAPRLSPYADRISARLAETLGIEASAVSVKATTTERLGFVGREEGMAAQAIALVAVNSTSRA
ncbi:MAG: 2-C-methyl-D-erythritol 2,4-cyclodiphosphate synthase, partial [Gemmatimonadetes bacterium]|nr:2-C-methyl-D-erythritol 2,4-cyclodiphosphate synthase [Gemmatimonadota bacterium]